MQRAKERDREKFQEGITQKAHSIKIVGEPHQLQSGESRSYLNVVTRGQRIVREKTVSKQHNRQVKFYIYCQFYKHAILTCIYLVTRNTRFGIDNFLYISRPLKTNN
jgi:hypothetical protein